MFMSHNSMFRRSVLFAAVVSWLPQAADAQVASEPRAGGSERLAAAANGDEFVLRTYWVGDLVLVVPDYPYPGGRALSPGRPAGGGFGGGGSFSIPEDPSIQFVQFGGGGGGMGGGNADFDSLIDVIVSTIATKSWAENGGEAEIRPFPTNLSLVISQTQAVHEEIADLLRQLRATAAERKTVTIDARWLLLNSDDLDRLMPDESAGLATLDRKLLAGLTRRPTTIRGLTHCISGQLVYVVSGTRRNVVSGYIPVVGSVERGRPAAADVRFAALRGGAEVKLVAEESALAGGREPSVGYQPIVEQPNFGALLEIRPTLMPKVNTAIVDLRSTLTVPSGRSDELAGRSETGPAPPVVDRIAIDTQELATTLRVPLGQPMLVGGMTYVPPALGSLHDAASRQPQAEALENPQFYLVLELR